MSFPAFLVKLGIVANKTFNEIYILTVLCLIVSKQHIWTIYYLVNFYFFYKSIITA